LRTTAVYSFFFPVQSKCRLFFQWCSAGWDEDDELRKEVGSVDEEEWQRFQE
jgi:hypothetical protein